MNECNKLITPDESGIAEEYEKALVISILEEGKVNVDFTHMAGLDIIRAAYTLVTIVENLGLMPGLQKFLEKGRAELEDIQFVE